MTTEEKLYDYYLKKKIEARKGAIEALKNREFDKLYTYYFSWYRRTEKRVEIKEVELSKLIILFQDIISNILPNESIPILETDYADYNEDKFHATSYLYTIKEENMCEIYARNCVKNDMWYLKHQPNGKDAARINEILKELIYD